MMQSIWNDVNVELIPDKFPRFDDGNGLVFLETRRWKVDECGELHRAQNWGLAPRTLGISLEFEILPMVVHGSFVDSQYLANDGIGHLEFIFFT
jgi:hypothetical protein